MNLFATVLTYPAPSANYRGESEGNRTVIQKITYGRFEYPVISPESIRNALRETLASYGLPCNRSRLNDEDQLAVRFDDYPDPDRYVDDFFFGYLVAAGKDDRKKILAAIKAKQRDDTQFRFKRDSVFRMNLARSVDPYRNNAIFTQSPLTVKSETAPLFQNSTTSALLHRETALTAFQYPFALNLNDCKTKPDWTKKLLKAIGELNGVAGNHARSYFEMAPASILIRLTNQLVAGYDTYGFDAAGNLPEVINGVLYGRPKRTQNGSLTKDEQGHIEWERTPDFPGDQFYIGGLIVKQLEAEHDAAVAESDKKRDKPDQRPKTRLEGLKELGVTVDRDPRRLLAVVGEKIVPAEGA
jgi:CRISPR-associated protein Cst2